MTLRGPQRSGPLLAATLVVALAVAAAGQDGSPAVAAETAPPAQTTAAQTTAAQTTAAQSTPPAAQSPSPAQATAAQSAPPAQATAETAPPASTHDAAETAPPTFKPSIGAWPTGDELRRELQAIGFIFRVEREAGDWLGWAPGASIDGTPALVLDGAGSAEASAAFSFDLLQTELLSQDIEAALSAFLEVAARLPLEARDADRTRRFLVQDLLTQPPEALEPCYANRGPGRVIVVTIERDTGLATLHLARALDRIEPGSDSAGEGPAGVLQATELDIETCAALVPSVDGVSLGDPTSERITIGMSTAEAQPRFDPDALTLEGSLVTLVLTFRNDSDVEQTLTFEEPLSADTGPVTPGDARLIVVRQLEPGVYAFYSATDPDGISGTITIETPQPE